jgi:hypothetical protein
MSSVDYLGLPANEKWRYYYKRWRYYQDSYFGGNEFREGTYLVPYVLESGQDYADRIKNTPLDNHCKSIVDTYNSFLFRTPAKRNYGSITNDPALEAFFNDADLDGRNFNAFMRDVSTYSSIYGHVWVMVDKPATNVGTRADELQQEIRPYVTMYTPENVIDWDYERQTNGLYTLKYFKVLENITDTGGTYREYYPDIIRLVEKKQATEETRIIEEYPNPLGTIPVVPIYSQRSHHRGVGISDLADIADMQRGIFNELSELEQVIRLSNHPSLVKTPETQAAAGAGAVIEMEPNIDPGLRPYLLQPSGANIDSILKSIEEKVNSINRMANMGGVRQTQTQAMSGIALQTEFQLLNARLSQKADNLELGEEHIWRLWCKWQNKVWDGEVKYPDSFNIHDKANTISLIKTAKETNPTNPKLLSEIDKELARAMIDDEDTLNEILESQVENDTVEQPVTLDTQQEHPPITNADDLVTHMKEMVEQGYTVEQIKSLHPELKDLFNRE